MVVAITESSAYFPGEMIKQGEFSRLFSERQRSLEDLCLDLDINGTMLDNVDRVLRNLGVEQRNLLVNPENSERWWARNQGGAPILNIAIAGYKSLMKDQEPLSEKDFLVVSTDFSDHLLPTLGAQLAGHAGNPYRVDTNTGCGCTGLVQALDQAASHLVRFPESRAVVLLVEAATINS